MVKPTVLFKVVSGKPGDADDLNKKAILDVVRAMPGVESVEELYHYSDLNHSSELCGATLREGENSQIMALKIFGLSLKITDVYFSRGLS